MLMTGTAVVSGLRGSSADRQGSEPPVINADTQPVYSYLRLAKNPGEDRDINLNPGGSVRQVFPPKRYDWHLRVIMSRPIEFGQTSRRTPLAASD